MLVSLTIYLSDRYKQTCKISSEAKNSILWLVGEKYIGIGFVLIGGCYKGCTARGVIQGWRLLNIILILREIFMYAFYTCIWYTAKLSAFMPFGSNFLYWFQMVTWCVDIYMCIGQQEHALLFVPIQTDDEWSILGAWDISYVTDHTPSVTPKVSQQLYELINWDRNYILVGSETLHCNSVKH